MSCCTIDKKPSSSTSSYISILEKSFDEVVIKQELLFNTITLQNKVQKKNYDYEVWLHVKVALGDTNSCSKNTEEKLEGALALIVDFLDALLNGQKKNKVLSLFEEEESIELILPESPANAEDGKWSAHYKACDKLRKEFAIKNHNFFDLIGYPGCWWTFPEDYSALLPSHNETLSLVKARIEDALLSEESYAKFDEYNYIRREGKLSDIELYSRVMSQIDIPLVSFDKILNMTIDNSYTVHVNDWTSRKEIFSLRGENVTTGSWNHREIPDYKFFNSDFITWLRNKLDVKVAEVVSDTSMLEEALEKYVDSFLWYESKNYDWKINIQSFDDWREFKKDIVSFVHNKGIRPNGGSSGGAIDKFCLDVSLDSKGKVVVYQDSEYRKSLGRDCSKHYASADREIVFELKADEIWKKIFELFKNEETNLFNFSKKLVA